MIVATILHIISNSAVTQFTCWSSHLLPSLPIHLLITSFLLYKISQRATYLSNMIMFRKTTTNLYGVTFSCVYFFVVDCPSAGLKQFCQKGSLCTLCWSTFVIACIWEHLKGDLTTFRQSQFGCKWKVWNPLLNSNSFPGKRPLRDRK